MKFAQKVRLDGEDVIVMVHNVEDKEEAIALLDKAQPLSSDDVQEYNGTRFLHLNSGLGYGKKITFTKDSSLAGATTACEGEWV
jgi:hypothetical protein